MRAVGRCTALLTIATVAGTAALCSASAHAAVIPVTDLSDGGANSLRAAITTANSTTADDVIDITVPGTISLTSGGLPSIAAVATGGRATIQGLGASQTIVNRVYAGFFSMLFTSTGADATITGMSFRNAHAGALGLNGVVKLDQVDLRDNATINQGGGIYLQSAGSSLTVDRSAITGNSAAGPSGGGGIFVNSNAALTVSRSTITGNTATASGNGGGIITFGAASSITGSTIAGNTVAATAPTDGANIYSQNGPVTLRDTLIADPLSSTAQPAVNCRSFGAGIPIISQGYNLADDATCSMSHPNDRPVADPGLNGLVGLAPPVLPIAPSSAAADKIPAASCDTATDQRGVARPQGGNCDIGAYEIEALPPLPFRNPATITTPLIGPAAPFPSEIAVGGLQGTVTGVSVRLDGLVHTFPSDIGALLVAPGGQTVDLLTAAGSSDDVSGVTLTIDDSGAVAPGNLPTGTYKPFNSGVNLAFGAPAPAGPFGKALSPLAGTAPNGTWKLFVQDFASGDSGRILSGWALDVRTTGPVVPKGPVTKPKCKKKRKKGKKAGAAAKKCKKKPKKK